MNESHNGWNEWSKYVLKELERHSDEQEKTNNKIDDVKDKLNEYNTTMTNFIVEQKTKAMVYGGIAGACVSAIFIIFGGLNLMFKVFGG